MNMRYNRSALLLGVTSLFPQGKIIPHPTKQLEDVVLRGDRHKK